MLFSSFLLWVQTSPVWAFIFLCTVATSLYDFGTNFSLRNKFMFNPYVIQSRKEWQRFFTCTLIHGDFFHLFFNMYTFYNFGPILERQMVIESGAVTGRVYFLIMYLFSTLISGLPTYGKQRNNPNYNALGASGAISGVLFSYILFAPNATLLLFGFIKIYAWVFALLFLGVSYIMAKKQLDNIGHEAHLWGALGGFAITCIFYPETLTQLLATFF